MSKNILNISAYQFVHLEKLKTLQAILKAKTNELALKGTILLGEEGINLMLAGEIDSIRAFERYMQADARFADLVFKESYSDCIPFQRMWVKIKKEIVTMSAKDIDVNEKRAAAISPQDLKTWLDENKDFVFLDVRNRYEIEVGKFAKAMDLDINYFRDFPAEALKQLKEFKDKLIVMYCTGGIRCEKAAIELQKRDFKQVYQLDGGILNYFTTCGGAHYQGNCFVFDDRVVIDANLDEVKK